MEDFPRGGSLPESTVRSGTKRKLFGHSTNNAIPYKQPKTEDFANSVWTDKLSYKRCPTDLITIACVRSVLKDHLILELPDSVRARLFFKDISKKFFDTIMTAGDDESFPSVDACFPPGQMLTCRVIDRPSVDCNRLQDMYLTVSTEPALVNLHMTVGSLQENMAITACVSSVEDKGYVMDIGFKNVCGFLPFSSCGIAPELMVTGRPLLCRVVSTYAKSKRVVDLSCTEDDLFTAKFLCTNLSKNQLYPGTSMLATVERVIDRGLLVNFPSGLKAFVLFHHFRYLTTKAASYKVGDQLPVVVMLFVPNSIIIGLSAEAALTDRPSELQRLRTMKIGDVCKGRIVVLSPRNCVFLKLGDNLYGQASSRHLEPTQGETVEQKYSKGSFHRCRIIGESLFSCHFFVSLKSSDLHQAFSTFEDARPGTKLVATVERATPGGVFLLIYKHFRGYIPPVFASDVLPGKVNLKKFVKGRKVKVQIVHRNAEQGQLVLTARKSWMESEDPVIQSYSSENIGRVITGVVVYIDPTGLLLCFHGGAKGFLKRSFLTGAEDDADWSHMYYVGQLLRVRILQVREKTMRLLVALASDDVAIQKDSSRECVSVLPLTKEFFTVAPAEVTEIASGGLKVRFQNTDGFIPSWHLTDTLSLSNLLCSTYRVGDTINECLLFRREGINVVTAKPAIVQAALSSTLIRNFEELLPKTVIHGVIKDYSERYGFFIDLPGHLSVRCPKCHIEDVEEMIGVVGSTVICRVKHVDSLKKLATVSMKLDDCLRIGGDSAMQLLNEYLKEMSKIEKHFANSDDLTKQRLSKLKLGDLIECTITDIVSNELICSFESDITVLVSRLHSDKPLTAYSVTESIKGVVLFVDFEKNNVEISCLNIVRQHEKKSTSKKAEVAVDGFQRGQIFDAAVVLVKADFILVCLLDHKSRQLCYMPSRLHHCDLSHTRSQYHVGAKFKVLVKRVSPQRVIVADVQLDATLKRVPRKPLAIVNPNHGKPSDNKEAWFYPHLGEVFPATVVLVREDFLLLKLSGCYRGRIHVTELQDTFQDGSRPLDQYNIGQKLSVKVIGYLPKVKRKTKDGRKRFRRTECSIKPSKLTLNSSKKSLIFYKMSFSVGEVVPVFITDITDKGIRATVNPFWRATASYLHFPRKKDSLEADKFCHQGCVYNARVIRVIESKRLLRLSFLNATQESARLFMPTTARIVRLCPTFVSLSFPDDTRAECSIVDITDDYDKTAETLKSLKVKDRVFVYPFKQTSAGWWLVSMRPSHLTPSTAENVRDKFVTANEVKVGVVLRGFVVFARETALVVSLAFNCTGVVPVHLVSSYMIADLVRAFPVGSVVTVKVLTIKMIVGTPNAKTVLSMLESDTGVADQLPVALRGSKRRIIKKEHDDLSYETSDKVFDTWNGKWKGETSLAEIELLPVSEDATERMPVMAASDQNEDIFSQLKQASSFNWQSDRFSMNNLMNVGFEPNAVASSSRDAPAASASNIDEESSSDEGEETKAELNLPASKRNRYEKEKIEEEEILKKEISLMDPDKPLDTAEDFDRLLLGSPNSSLLWLRYMAFFLQTAEVAKARLVGERALKTIPATEEAERFNIWVALFNLENLYGTKDSLSELIERAMSQNDHLKVSTHLLKIYKKSQKFEEADSLAQDMLRKYKSEIDVWIMISEYYMESKRPELARSLVNRALKSLPSNMNVAVVSRFAQLEFRLGDKERGRTLFENLVQDFPRRTDVWLVYIDMVVKYLGIEETRPIFEKVTSLQFSSHKMRTFYQKWLNLEERYGSEEVIDQVRERAAVYLKTLTDAMSTGNEQQLDED